MKVKNFFRRLFSGLAVGITDAIPGVSGGTTAVIVNIYDELVFSIAKLGKQFKKSMGILLPIVLGILIGLIPCLFLFDLGFEYFAFGLVCIFGGLMIGCFPSLTKEVRGVKVKQSYIWMLVIGLVVAVGLGVLSAQLEATDSVASIFHFEDESLPSWWFYFIILAVGFIYAFFTIVPGISGSMVCLVTGFYTNVVGAFTDWTIELFNGNFTNTVPLVLMLIALVIGLLLGFWVVSKVMSVLLRKYRNITYYLIIGFVVGSIISLFYNNTICDYYSMWANGGCGSLSMWWEIGLGIGLLIICIGLGLAFSYAQVWRRRKQATLKEGEGINGETTSEETSEQIEEIAKEEEEGPPEEGT